MPIGTLTKRTDLQPNAAVRTPPEMDPAAKPADSTATKMPRARFLSLPSGNVVTRIAKAVAGGKGGRGPSIGLDQNRERGEWEQPPLQKETVERKEHKTNGCLWP